MIAWTRFEFTTVKVYTLSRSIFYPLPAKITIQSFTMPEYSNEYADMHFV
jgi:hypothetical protein